MDWYSGSGEFQCIQVFRLSAGLSCHKIKAAFDCGVNNKGSLYVGDW